MSKNTAYVVFIGRIPGIYETWEECEEQVKGFPKCRFQGYKVYEDAIAAWDRFEQRGHIAMNAEERRAMHNRKHRANKKKLNKWSSLNEHAQRLVASNSEEGSGSRRVTCTATTCTYPACKCS